MIGYQIQVFKTKIAQFGEHSSLAQSNMQLFAFICILLSISGTKADYFENLFSDILLEKNQTDEYELYEDTSTQRTPEVSTLPTSTNPTPEVSTLPTTQGRDTFIHPTTDVSSESGAEKDDNSTQITGVIHPSTTTVVNSANDCTYVLLFITVGGCLIIIFTGVFFLAIKLKKKTARQSGAITLTNYNFNPSQFDEISL